MKKRRIKKYGLSMIAFLIAITLSTSVSAASELPTEAPAQAQTMQQDRKTEKTVHLKLKAAEVPDGFADAIDISYAGQFVAGNEFTITLNSENSYEVTIPVVEDAYTLKSLNSASSIDMDIAKSFSLMGADPDKIYYLPISVYQSNTQAEETYIKIKVSAKEAAESLGYTGIITVNYTGTNGNEFSVPLDSSSDYTAELNLTKDVYTKESILLDEGFEADAMYSFDLTNASKEVTYRLDVNLTQKPEEEVTSAEPEEILISDGFQAEQSSQEPETTIQQQTQLSEQDTPTKRGVIRLSEVPENFSGDLIVTYKEISNGLSITVGLNAANSYTALVAAGVPYGTYKLESIFPTEETTYAFSGPDTLVVDDTTESSFIVTISPVNSNEKEDVNKGSLAPTTSLGTTDILLIVLIISIIATGIVVIVIFIKKKNTAPAVYMDSRDLNLENEIDDIPELDDDMVKEE